MNPRNLYDPTTYKTTHNVLSLRHLSEDLLEVHMLLDPTKFKFASIHHVFSCIRSELSAQGEPGFLIKNSARYFIADEQLKIPALFNPHTNAFIFDPLLPYRNAIIELYKGYPVTLQRLPARVHYFAPGTLPA